MIEPFRLNGFYYLYTAAYLNFKNPIWYYSDGIRLGFKNS